MQIIKSLQTQRSERAWKEKPELWLKSFEEYLLKGTCVDRDGAYSDLSEAATGIPPDFLQRVITEYGRRHGLRGAIELHYAEQAGRGQILHHLSLSQQLAFLPIWHSMKHLLDDNTPSARQQFGELAAAMLQAVCRHLGRVELTDFRYSDGFIHGFALSGSLAPQIRLPTPMPVLVLQKTALGARDIDEFWAYNNNWAVRLYIGRMRLVITLDSEREPGSTKKQVRQVLDSSPLMRAVQPVLLDIRDIYYAVRDGETSYIASNILNQAGLAAVSPYRVAGPVRGDEFFGRESEIARIYSTLERGGNIAITGGQRIGKTSILFKVRDQLEASRACPIWIDCELLRDRASFADSVSEQLGEEVDESPQSLYRALRNAARQYAGKSLVFLLDDVDPLLALDAQEGQPLFQVFRALSQERVCQFVFCGHGVLRQKLRDGSHCLINFCEKSLIIGMLDRPSAYELVLGPMRAMAIEMETGYNPADDISTASSCHPNIMQWICKCVVEGLDKRRGRHLERRLVTEVLSRQDFHEYYVDTAWGGSTPLEKLITLSMTKLDQRSFSRQDAYLALGELGVQDHEEIDQALEALIARSVLETGRQGRNYYFTLSQFPRIARQVVDVEHLINHELRQVRR